MFARKFRLLSILLLVILVLAVTAGTAAAAATIIRATVQEFGDQPRQPDPEVAAQGTLRREADGISYHIHTSNLDPGAAYTNWAVVFNKPEECGDDGCNGGDFGNREVMASVFWATGEVIPNSTSGIANFNAFIPVNGNDENPDVRFGPGLLDADNAEVHVVIRTHGQPLPDPDDLLAQLTTVGGGCDVNDCFDQQGIAFVE